MAQPAPFEFSPAQNAFARSLARSTKIQGWLFFVAGAVTVTLGLVGLITGAPLAALTTGLLGAGLLAMGTPLLRAAGSFRLITETPGMDISHLMAGLAALRRYYDALALLSLALGGVTLFFGLFAGGVL